ncbi:sigma 54-interacting transcriptional regulator [Alloacidobacterium dinghuense]|uniref:Sigma 54-interacting transcriptional regulator n=1 Tax=Alloacidobacterium dinghuense TaxID=2763107 RepID=A0A7G8BPY6_9BACT|nr:sigma 54-interacting transcriptional regulator [Alloacidobacterium dinghuense]QNI34606.1 sigma 54-interacting transcriptional regulator [Alloacidobacterium dinghuense]
MSVEQYVEAVRKDEEFILYRDEHTNQPGSRSVLRLVPASLHPALETLKKIEHEYSLRDELDPAWAVRPLALSDHRGQTALLLEDPGGETLDQFLSEPMQITRFLRLAVGLATALSGLHKKELIHKDVKPSNVLVDPAGHVRLMGFGIASRLPRERQAPKPPEFIAGTLPYMSPEQTGRMNRSIDSRSDLYSLGVTLYEMLTGDLPFAASDPMEWVHCHIARQPMPPGERINGIPGPVSAIIIKLLAKTAEDRYQAAYGVERDLQHCLAELETQHRIDEFPLGKQDTSDRLLVAEKLYGRESEIAALLAAFDRVVADGSPEFVLVSGYSGIGKSSVVNELHKSLVPSRGLFASGKFDQYKRDIPYATLAQALQNLLLPLLSKSEVELSKWRDALHEALAPNGQLIVDLVPEFKLIIGEQLPVPELPPQDAQGRFQLVFRRFISVFTRPEHPLVLFLDDLQWLDTATLDLIEDLLTQPDVRHLMVIGAYRDNEVDSSHPLMRKLEAIRQVRASVQEIVLAPLAVEDLDLLLADSVYCEPERATPLAQLIHEKTAGNPFFAIQFISALAEEGLLIFDHGNGRWFWDLNRIRAKGYTDNVVDLLIGKLNRLSVETRNALQLLACMGNSAAFVLLEMASQHSNEEVHGWLWEAVRTGLIFRMEDSYRFLHDRVQEAAYSLISEELRAEAHLRIGRLLAAHTPPESREERIFEVVNQLNRGAALITARDEREQLAELNLIAGKRAKASAAYTSALTYFTAGTSFLGDDSWKRLHELRFSLELNRAECEFVTGQSAAAEERLTVLSSRALTTIELATVTCLQVDLYTSLDQNDRAIAVCLDYLRHLGMEWSAHPTKEEVKREYAEIWSRLGDRDIEELVELPLMNNPVSLATLDVLTKVLPPALFSDANLLSLAICRAVNLSLEGGNSDGSCVAYVWLGQIAGPHFGDYKAGYRFGLLGYELVEKRGLTRFQARTSMVFACHVLPWAKHVRAGRDLIYQTFEVANRIGDLCFAAFSGINLNTHLLAAGDPLSQVQREAENGFEFARRTRFGFAINVISVQLALIRTFRGLTPEFGRLDDEQFEEQRFERHLGSDSALAQPECFYWIRKLQARFFAGDYVSAVDASLHAQRLLWSAPSNFEAVDYHYYGALSLAASWDSASSIEKQQTIGALAAHQRQLEVWTENCPENFENRAALVSAEIARIEGRVIDAEQLYEKAIRSAHENGFIHNEALANELTARFYAARGFDKIADVYLRDARYGYLRWGAGGKVKQLDQLYPHLKKEEPAPGRARTIVAPVEVLDLSTIIKVSQAVSGEMVLEKLIDRIMRAAIEHAGATRGILIFSRGHELQIEAEATTSGDDVTVHMRDASARGVGLPESLVRYVMRTHERVILDDASSQNWFSTDPYFLQHQTRSVLCLPLTHQAELTGVLYLENNLASHVFTPERTTVLKVLASQAAISLENTWLYRDLEDREAKIRRLVDANVLGIFFWNLEGGIVGANEEFLRMVDYDREDLASGRVRWTDLTPEEWRKRDEQAIADVIRTGSVQPFEKEFFRKNGTRVPVLVGSAMFEGSRSEGVAFVLDLSEQKRAEGEIRALKDQLYRENLALHDAYREISELKEKLVQEKLYLEQEIRSDMDFEQIVGNSQALKRILQLVETVGPSDSTVLLLGETGTGKELIARAIHDRSGRKDRTFVKLNCAAIPTGLLESELFGHEKGAFTGAIAQRIGRLELADQGTLFLDEVGDIPIEIQPKLLRALQEREFERLGSTHTRKVNVRLIAATNRDLEKMIAAREFRSDLYYRLNVFPIRIPPLRERKGDIPLLVSYFVQKFAKQMQKKIDTIPAAVMKALAAWEWLGNVRELENFIERAVILTRNSSLEAPLAELRKVRTEEPMQAASNHDDVVRIVRETINALQGKYGVADERTNKQRDAIVRALAETKGRVGGSDGAAARMGINRTTLLARMKKFGIDPKQYA